MESQGTDRAESGSWWAELHENLAYRMFNLVRKQNFGSKSNSGSENFGFFRILAGCRNTRCRVPGAGCRVRCYHVVTDFPLYGFLNGSLRGGGISSETIQDVMHGRGKSRPPSKLKRGRHASSSARGHGTIQETVF